MRDFQLGDYKGGRDSITGLMGAEIPQLKNINQAALTFGSIGLQSMAQRHALEQRADAELRNKMMLSNQSLAQQMGVARNNYEFMSREKALAAAAAQEAEAESISGQESAMLDWASNVIGLYEPNSPEYKQAVKTFDMLKGRRKGSNAFNKGYLSFVGERNINDMMSQGAAGAAGWQEAKKPTPAADKKPVKKSVKGAWADIDTDFHS